MPLPVPEEATTQAVFLKEQPSRALDLITISSIALPAPEGTFNGATVPNFTNWRKRDPLKDRLHLYRLEEEMSREANNTLKIIKTNMAPSETSVSTTTKHVQPNTDEAKVNDQKKNFIKMIEVLQ